MRFTIQPTPLATPWDFVEAFAAMDTSRVRQYEDTIEKELLHLRLLARNRKRPKQEGKATPSSLAPWFERICCRSQEEWVNRWMVRQQLPATQMGPKVALWAEVVESIKKGLVEYGWMQKWADSSSDDEIPYPSTRLFSRKRAL